MTQPDIYDIAAAEIYDAVELGARGETPATNDLIRRQLHHVGARTVLDMTCGTGAQTIALYQAGFDVTASDLSDAMLSVAERKSRELGLEIPFHTEDMRTVSLGLFDAIISIFNSIGHLSKEDFALTIRNAAGHLNDGGIYMFDIFKSEMMAFVPAYEVIDAMCEVKDKKFVRFTKSTFDATSGVVSFQQRTYAQQGMLEPRELLHRFSLQTYKRDELEQLLLENGFDKVTITDESMSELPNIQGFLHFVVARKVRCAF